MRAKLADAFTAHVDLPARTRFERHRGDAGAVPRVGVVAAEGQR